MQGTRGALVGQRQDERAGLTPFVPRERLKDPTKAAIPVALSALEELRGERRSVYTLPRQCAYTDVQIYVRVK
ncbi:hypothetical protein KM043_006918 [Ampulex compressa]|nr:hypothetical protein KM043_006918 [Ampulex compressa]